MILGANKQQKTDDSLPPTPQAKETHDQGCSPHAQVRPKYTPEEEKHKFFNMREDRAEAMLRMVRRPKNDDIQHSTRPKTLAVIKRKLMNQLRVSTRSNPSFHLFREIELLTVQAAKSIFFDLARKGPFVRGRSVYYNWETDSNEEMKKWFSLHERRPAGVGHGILRSHGQVLVMARPPMLVEHQSNEEAEGIKITCGVMTLSSHGVARFAPPPAGPGLGHAASGGGEDGAGGGGHGAGVGADEGARGEGHNVNGSSLVLLSSAALRSDVDVLPDRGDRLGTGGDCRRGGGAGGCQLGAGEGLSGGTAPADGVLPYPEATPAATQKKGGRKGKKVQDTSSGWNLDKLGRRHARGEAWHLQRQQRDRRGRQGLVQRRGGMTAHRVFLLCRPGSAQTTLPRRSRCRHRLPRMQRAWLPRRSGTIDTK